MKLNVYNLDKEQVGEIEVSDAVFGAEVKPYLHHEVVRYQLAKRRAGTHAVLNRKNVSGSTRKLFKQKGTGRARSGSIKSPTYVGGGIAFGPTPRSYAFKLPRKVRRGALRSVLSQKVANEQLLVLESFNMDAPKTKLALAHLEKLGASRALVVDIENDALKLSVRNLKSSKFLPSKGLNVYDLIHFDHLVITKAAITEIDGALNR